jgi:hypothetical protein
MFHAEVTDDFRKGTYHGHTPFFVDKIDFPIFYLEECVSYTDL